MGAFARMEDDLAARRLLVVPLAVPAPAGEYGFIRARHRSPSQRAPLFVQAVRDEERAYAEQKARDVALQGIRRAP